MVQIRGLKSQGLWDGWEGGTAARVLVGLGERPALPGICVCFSLLTPILILPERPSGRSGLHSFNLTSMPAQTDSQTRKGGPGLWSQDPACPPIWLRRNPALPRLALASVSPDSSGSSSHSFPRGSLELLRGS